jgi:Na+-translocating ferredoxin:NAD+ oxidoreductase subunit C
MSLFASARGIRLPSPSPTHRDIVDLPLPRSVVLPMRQAAGAPAAPAVEVGDEVAIGTVVGTPTDAVGVPILATISGKVIAVEERPGPEGRDELSVVIEGDGEERWLTEPAAEGDWSALTPQEMLDRVRNAGVITSGFGAEPSHRDLATAIDPRGFVGVSGAPVMRSVEHLIVRAVDVDPAIDTLDTVLLNHLEEARQGFEVIKHILGATSVHLVLDSGAGRGLDDRGVEQLCDPLEIWPVPARPWQYPSVNDAMLIKSIAGFEVGGAFSEPRDMGVIVENIDTVIDVGRAVQLNRPQIDRVVHVIGRVGHSRMVRVRIGTPMKDVLEACGGTQGAVGSIIFGGPMRGRAQHSVDAPVTRLSGAMTVLGEDELVEFTNEPCMNCGACVSSCPVRLRPNTLSMLCEYDRFEDALAYDLLTCIECGCCAYVCPSRRANVHYLLHGKTEVMSRRLRS